MKNLPDVLFFVDIAAINNPCSYCTIDKHVDCHHSRFPNSNIDADLQTKDENRMLITKSFFKILLIC